MNYGILITSGYSEVSDLESGVFKSNTSSQADLQLMLIQNMAMSIVHQQFEGHVMEKTFKRSKEVV